MSEPLCECHGEPQLWHADKRKVKGGYWQCGVKHREARRRCEQSEKGRATKRRYRQSEKGREVLREAQRRYEQSEKGRAVRFAYVNSPEGVAAAREYNYRRRRKYREQANKERPRQDRGTADPAARRVSDN